MDEGAAVEMVEGRTVAILLRRRRFACAAAGTELGHAQQLSLASTSSSSPDSPPPPPPPIRRCRVSGEGAGEGDGMETASTRWVVAGSNTIHTVSCTCIQPAGVLAQTMARRRNWQHWGRVEIVMANFEIAEL